MARAIVASVALVAVLAGCSDLDAQLTCAAVAHDYGPDFQVAGAFNTTTARIRAVTPGEVPRQASDLPGGQPAVACYLDGPFAKSPPGGEPFNRGLIAVANGRVDLIMLGYQDRLPVRAP